jgi:hypothetical protein
MITIRSLCLALSALLLSLGAAAAEVAPRGAAIPLNGEPYVTSWSADPGGAVARTVESVTVMAADRPVLEAHMKRNTAALDQAVRQSGEARLATFPRTPNFKSIREVSGSLVVRALMRHEKDTEASVRDLLAALRMGRALAQGQGYPIAITAMIGYAMQKPAVRVLTSWASSGRLKAEHARRVQAELAHRQEHPMPTPRQMMEGEGRFAGEALAKMTPAEAKAELWKDGSPPLPDAELARVLPTLRKRVEEHYRKLGREVGEGKLVPFRPFALPANATGADRVLARAIDISTPNLEAIVKRVREREGQIGDLRGLIDRIAGK